MAEYQIGSSGNPRIVTRRTVTSACDAFRLAVFEATAAQALRDVPAGWDAHHAALRACEAMQSARAGSQTVTIGQRTVIIERVA